MAINLTNSTTMVEATQALNNALDKADTGEQVVNGKILVQDENGDPVPVSSANQIITKKFVDDKLGAYFTLNLSLPWNIDMDSEILIETHGCTQYMSAVFPKTYTSYDTPFTPEYASTCTLKQPTVFWMKTNGVTYIKGIQLPKYCEYKIYYISDKTTTYSEYVIPASFTKLDLVDLTTELQPSACITGYLDFAATPTRTTDAFKLAPSTWSGYTNAELMLKLKSYNGGYCAGDTYYYAFFVNDCNNIVLPSGKDVELFILGAGFNAKGSGVASHGGNYITKTVSKNDGYVYMSVSIGQTTTTDSGTNSSVTLSNANNIVTTTISSGDTGHSYSTSDGVYPFSESAFSRRYGAAGSTSYGVQYQTGGGYNGQTALYHAGNFFGAGCYSNHTTLASQGFQGIVIMRWK